VGSGLEEETDVWLTVLSGDRITGAHSVEALDRCAP
jgi:hypothetical protein